MKIYLYLTLIICFMACSKDKAIDHVDSLKLVSIHYSDMKRDWHEEYSYAGNDKLILIEMFGRLNRRYEMEYTNDLLVAFSGRQMSDDKLVERVTILYNLDGAIQEIEHYAKKSNNKLEVSSSYGFEYDHLGMVSTRKAYSGINKKLISTDKYFWNDGNINKVEHRNSESELRYELFYEYDDKVNYKIGLPLSLYDPINWSKNNATKMELKDHIGNIDGSCNPCIVDYEYNLEGYPVFINIASYKELILKYMP